MLELPPRVRRILGHSLTVFIGEGTTSACAENTLYNRFDVYPAWNYLRVCGEYRSSVFSMAKAMELPPRVRRIPKRPRGETAEFGTTSACAENTHRHLLWAAFSWNYLRVCGEYVAWHPASSLVGELPPRVRRIPCEHETLDYFKGTTSACAENT